MAAFRRFPGLLALVLAFPSALTATTLLELSAEQLTARASDIVQGTCTEVQSVWIDRGLVTLATISVTDTLKGGGSREMTVVVPGGIDLNRPVPVAVTWPGAPLVMPDDEVLLFLEQNTPVKGGYNIVGYSQGKYSVVRDVLGRTLASPSRGMHPDATDLESFKRQIRELISGQGRKGGTVQ
jgi:hypothetical protein